MECSLDTNILLRLILNDIPAQADKAEKLLEDRDQIFYIPDMAIAETIFQLQTAGMPRANLVAEIMFLAKLPNVRISTLVVDQVLPFFSEHPALSFVDCYMAFEADAAKREPLWTFDRRLANQHPSAKRLD